MPVTTAAVNTTDSNSNPIGVPSSNNITVSSVTVTIAGGASHNVFVVGEFSAECPQWAAGLIVGDIQIDGQTFLNAQVNDLEGGTGTRVVVSGVLTIPHGTHRVDLRAYTQTANVTAHHRALSVIELNTLGGAVTVASTGDLSDRTAELQAILDNAGHVYLGPGVYVISNHLDVRSNTRVQLHPRAVIQRSATTPLQTQMIRLGNVHNVIIEGGVIDGNKTPGPPGAGGQCSGVTFSGSHDVVIRDIEIKNFPEDATDPHTGDQHGSYGDGIYIGSGGDTGYAYRIRISNVYSHGHERHGLFMVAGKDIVIENSVFSDITGDEPGTAMNFEPNSYGEVIQNVVVRNCVMETSQGGLTANNHYSGYWHDILFDGCTFRNNRHLGAACTGAGLSQSNFRFVNCVFVNNLKGAGLSAGGAHGLEVVGCRIEGNLGNGIEIYQCRDFTVRGCHIHNQSQNGIAIRIDGNYPAHSVIEGNSIVGNGEVGVAVAKSVPFSTEVAGLQFAHNRTGNLRYLQYPDRISGHVVGPDFRIMHGGKVYECITPGLTAPVIVSFDSQTANFSVGRLVRGGTSGATGTIVGASDTGSSGTLLLGDVAGAFIHSELVAETTTDSHNHVIIDPAGGSARVAGMPVLPPGPTGTGADIVDGDAHWQYRMDVPRQRWGYELHGEAARGAVFTRNMDYGNLCGHIREWPVGDAQALFTADILETQTDGQYATPLTRSRMVAFEDRSSPAGNIATYYAAGIAAVAKGASKMTIGTPFAKAGDGVHVTLRDLDNTLTRLVGKVTGDSAITVTGDANATNDCSFFWELVKAGRFPYDFPPTP